ncbi:class II aldolase/adducin family protein [Duganella sp. FT92W]|uniref:Class II aldolase/adducin family protein n=1 Tax=Pseudoduganella rivuli TaxID=2666085 RepID=A0A7X2IIS1_9BURK|nr:class II aldolase/adducin family protein [Pseudoduganella rivuli]MRV70438.1 class II aldolase/adducin family protein [Pseudoduganella rivuli]
MLAHKERQRIVDLCVDLSRRGYLAGTGGNVALRIDAGHFAVTPSATDYLAMGAADVCVVRLADLHLVEGERAPSVETGLHARVLRLRPDVRCSIHTHQPVASAWALMREPLTPPGARSGDGVPMVGYMPSGSGLLTRLVGRAVRPGVNAYLMRNHGVICCGVSVEAAVAAVDDLERLARRQLAHRISQRAAARPDRAFALQRVLTALEGKS